VTRPVIGICSAVERASWGVWQVLANVSPRSYTEAVQRAGAMALLLPPDDDAAESPDQMLDLLDGLILAGGSDVDPASYGARPHEQTGITWPERDRFELGLAHRAIERDVPLLGICRGMQLLSVACGGTLEQHLPDVTGDERHRAVPGAFSEHPVRLDPGSLAARSVGAEETTVRSHHHQAVAELGEGLVASGRSVPDDLVEAIELPERRHVLGVLWHPEEDARSRVIGTLVEEARAKVEAA
jgi:putative glutamine amidotransferase